MAELQPKSVHRFGQVPLAVLRDPHLTHADKTVYAALAAHRNHRTGKAWPSRATLAQIVGIHPDSVTRSTRRLAALGYIIKTDGRGRGRGTVYMFPPADPAPKPQSAGQKPDRADCLSPPTPICRTENQNHAAPSSAPDPAPSATRGEFSKDPRDQNTASTPAPALHLPIGIPAALVPALLLAVKHLPWNARQTLLDELQGAMQHKTIHNPAGYLRALVRLWEAGTLIPEHAGRIRRERQRREENTRAYQNAINMRPPPPKTPARSTATPDRIAALRATLRGSRFGSDLSVTSSWCAKLDDAPPDAPMTRHATPCTSP
jgi:hypothetical protein